MALLVAIVSATLGGLLGAWVTGAQSRRLAQRAERRTAKAGMHALRRDLTSAQQTIGDAMWAEVWWEDVQAPRTPAWDAFQAAMVAQLPDHTVGQLLDAVQLVAEQNTRAELRRRLADRDTAGQDGDSQTTETPSGGKADDARDTKGQVGDATASEGGEGQIGNESRSEGYRPRLIRVVRPFKPSELSDLPIASDEYPGLHETVAALDKAVESLSKPETLALLNEPSPRFRPRQRWAVVAAGAAVLVLALAVSWWIAPRAFIPAETVAQVLASELGVHNGARVGCEAAKPNTDSRWACEVIYDYAACPTATGERFGSPDETGSPAALRAPTRTPTVAAARPSTVKAVNALQAPSPGCGGVEDYDVRLSSGSAASMVKRRASGLRLEPRDPRPARDGANVNGGTVPVPADDASDSRMLRLPDVGRRAWWMFWKRNPATAVLVTG
jgi:hypothetical protein